MIETAIVYGDGLHPAGASGQEIKQIIAPYQDRLNGRDFYLSVHVDIYRDTNLEKLVNDYEENGIHRVIFDLSRGDIKPEERIEFLERLSDYVRNF